MDGDGVGDPLDRAATVAHDEAGAMSPLTRVVLTNLRVRFLVQIPVFVAYRILSAGLR